MLNERVASFISWIACSDYYMVENLISLIMKLKNN